MPGNSGWAWDSQAALIEATSPQMAYARLKELVGEISLTESPKEIGTDPPTRLEGIDLVVGRGFIII